MPPKTKSSKSTSKCNFSQNNKTSKKHGTVKLKCQKRKVSLSRKPSTICVTPVDGIITKCSNSKNKLLNRKTVTDKSELRKCNNNKKNASEDEIATPLLNKQNQNENNNRHLLQVCSVH